MSRFEGLVIRYLRLIASIVSASAAMIGPDNDTKRLLITQLKGLSKESDKFLQRR